MSLDPTWPAVGMAAVANVATWIVLARRNGNGKANGKPGMGEICRKQGERIAKLEEAQENTEKTLNRIETKLDKALEANGR